MSNQSINQSIKLYKTNEDLLHNFRRNDRTLIKGKKQSSRFPRYVFASKSIILDILLNYIYCTVSIPCTSSWGTRVLVSSVVYRGFEFQSGQTKDYKIEGFVAENAPLMRKRKVWLGRIQFSNISNLNVYVFII